MVVYMIALHLLLCSLQNFVYGFIDMDNNNQKKKKKKLKKKRKKKKKKKKKTEKKNCKCKIDVRLSLKMGGMLYMVRAALVRGPLSYITC